MSQAEQPIHCVCGRVVAFTDPALVAEVERLKRIEKAARRVFEIHEREQFGDETLSGFEWGDALRELGAAVGGDPE